MRRARAIAADPVLILRATLILAAWVLLHLYAGRPLVVAARTAGADPGLMIVLMGLLSAIPLAGFFAGRVAESFPLKDSLQTAGYLVMGLFSLLFVLVLATDVVRVAVWLIGLAALSVPWWNDTVFANPATLPLVNRTLHFAVAGGTLVMAVVGFFQARCPGVKKVTIPIENLPLDLAGMRIVQISDLHVGPTVRRDMVERVVEMANAEHPDVIAITGDLVDGHVDDLRDRVAPLRHLSAIHGVFYVTGNHEYYWDAPSWLAEAERLGMKPLVNQHHVIRRGEALLTIAGVTDLYGKHFDPHHRSDASAAFAGAPEDSLRVLLAHQPQSSRDATNHGVHLQLSGHTHGGQYFPFNLLIRFFQPIVDGLHRIGGMWLYVSRGTGYWGPPTRLGVRGEITVLELRAS